jgi:RNA polymerase sigma-70 factor (ECF subfamily)
VSESNLLKRARCFDEQALTEVYDRYSNDIYRYAVRLLSDQDLAEECVAETFSRFLIALRGGGGPRSYLRAYLYRVAHNWITDYYRRRPLPELPLNPEIHSKAGSDPHQSLTEKLEREEVRAALFRLTPEQRQVIILKYLDGWKNEEIAQVLEKRVGAVKALQHRALNALRRLLVSEEEIG